MKWKLIAGKITGDAKIGFSGELKNSIQFIGRGNNKTQGVYQ